MLTKVFNAQDTAPLGIEAILAAGSHDLGPKAARIENPAEWTREKILERAKGVAAADGPKGNFDD
jgi:fructose-bisphosphate aldolase class II